MDNKTKALLAVAGVGVLLLLPIFKVGKERRVSALGVLARHTIFYKEAGQIDDVMVEETYAKLFKNAGFKGERHVY